eukprot:scaffold149784_cov13-Tisochrysis_lutea.AAC.1
MVEPVVVKLETAQAKVQSTLLGPGSLAVDPAALVSAAPVSRSRGTAAAAGTAAIAPGALVAASAGAAAAVAGPALR